MTINNYAAGPTLQPRERPWPYLWESDPQIDDGHAHEWQRVHLIGDGKARRHTEDVIRCAVCRAPRCGDSTDFDPCMERRHHDGLHIHLSGMFRPVGDLLAEE